MHLEPYGPIEQALHSNEVTTTPIAKRNPAFWFGIGAILLATGIAFVIVYKRKKKKADDESDLNTDNSKRSITHS